jgi:hypothetical protein
VSVLALLLNLQLDAIDTATCSGIVGKFRGIQHVPTWRKWKPRG